MVFRKFYRIICTINSIRWSEFDYAYDAVVPMGKKLVWIDLEMTGLDVDRHGIIEIATIITDEYLQKIAEGPNLIIHQPEEALVGLDDWVMKTHSESKLFDAVQQSTLKLQEAEEKTLAFISKHIEAGKAPLCGNSIGTDRAFLRKYMPKLEAYLHYRNIDVSSIKILYHAWNKGVKPFYKETRHRALDDIRDSIDELAFYKKNFFKCDQD